MCYMGPLSLHSTSKVGTMAPTFPFGSKRLQMTRGGNVSMAPSPVDSAPGELTVVGHDEQND